MTKYSPEFKLKIVREYLKGKQFQQDVIIVAVGYYLRYNLSYREVQEILYDSRFKTLQQNRLLYDGRCFTNNQSKLYLL